LLAYKLLIGPESMTLDDLEWPLYIIASFKELTMQI